MTVWTDDEVGGDIWSDDEPSQNTTADEVTFVQSGSESTASTVQPELRRWVRPEHKGAIADGVTNDRAALAAADTLATSSGTILFQAGKTYLCSTSLTISANCYFEPGANISISSGQTLTINGRVISLGGSPITGSGTGAINHDGSIIFNAEGGEGGFSFGPHVPSGTDDYFSLRRSVNTSAGIIVDNTNTGSSADAFIHIRGGELDVTGSRLRFAAQSGAMGGEINIVGTIFSLGTNPNAALNIINSSNAPVWIYANNKKQLKVSPVSNTVNHVEIRGASTGSGPQLNAISDGTDTNVNWLFSTLGAGSHFFRTGGNGGVFQLEVSHTASADRRVTITGSNGGNPTISVSAGSLAITPAVVTASSITTGAPSGGTAGAWKFGVASATSPTSPNRTIELDVDGTIYYLHAKTSNN